MVSSEQRRKQLARQKFLRQQERRAARRRKARIRNIAIACGAAVVIAAGAAYAATGGLRAGARKSDAADSADKATASPSKAPDPCAKPAKGEPGHQQWKKEPALRIDKSAAYTLSLATTCGDIGVSMDAGKAPHTVNSFRFLAGRGYFDHTRCHRLVDQGIHVLQCGDPKGTGAGGPGYTVPDEDLHDPALKGGKYPAGTVAMANRYNPQTKKGKNTGGSQFFLVFKDSELPAHYTPFGKISSGGMKVLKKIADAGAQPPDPQTQNTAPNATVVINKASVHRS